MMCGKNMINEENPVEFMKEYCEFGEDRVYILMGLARKRYNPELTHNTEIVLRRIVKDKKDIQRKYDEIMGMIERKGYNFYLYMSVNARNTYKGFFHLQNRMNEWVRHLLNGDENQKRKFKKVDNYWMSELQKPRCKDETNFLYDVDKKDIDVGVLIDHLKARTEVKTMRPTRNGYHIITDTFDYTEDTLTKRECLEIKKDDMIYLNFIEG